MKTVLFFLILILVAGPLLGVIIFPVDFVNYLPAFAASGWVKVHNSLLADPFFQFEPWRHFAKTELLNGRIPLWNPYNGFGVPFLANPQVALFYPLNFIYYLLPVSVSLYVTPVLKVFLMGIFTYMYCRVIGISKFASIFASVAAPFSGFVIMWILWPHTNVFILLPLVIYLVEKIRLTDHKHRYLFLISISYFVGVTGGHPETLFHLGIIHVVYSLFRLSFSLFLRQMIFVLTGMMMAAFLLLPFLEYVLNSQLISGRILNPPEYFLPLSGLIYNIFPIILGAPHHQFYRQLAEGMNFQELAGGFVGIPVLAISLLGMFKLRMNIHIRIFTLLFLISWLITYKVWPFYLIVELPLISSVAHHRLIGFSAFFLVVIAAITTDLLVTKKNSTKLFKRFFIICGVLFAIGIPVFFVLRQIAVNAFPDERLRFLPYLFYNLYLYYYSSLFTIFLFLIALKRRMRKVGIGIMLAGFFISNILLFVNYSGFHSVKKYYPQNELIDFLKANSSGTIMQVGNLNFPANINLIYELPNAQSEDAIGVKAIQQKISEKLGNKSKLGVYENIKLLSLQEMGISYVVSDYNLNAEIQSVNSGWDNVVRLSPKPLSLKFQGKKGALSQIRVVTATYNRINDCIFLVTLLEEKTKLFEKKIECSELHDNSFYSIDINNHLLEDGKIYEVTFAIDTGENQSIGLRGSSSPYMDLLYGSAKGYKKIWEKSGVYVYEVPKANEVRGVLRYKKLVEKPEELTLIYETNKDSTLTLAKTQYPGWNAYIDNNKVPLNKSHFLEVRIPSGKHHVSFKYQPITFFMGVLVSIISAVFLLVYVLRKERGNNFFKTLLNRGKLQSEKSIMKLYGGGIILGFVCMLVLLAANINFTAPDSDGINWYTQNNYPRTRDQFYFYCAVVSFIALPIIFLLVGLWKSSRKKK